MMTELSFFCMWTITLGSALGCERHLHNFLLHERYIFLFSCICHWQYMLKDLRVLPSSGNSVSKKKRENRLKETLGSYIWHDIMALLRLTFYEAFIYTHTVHTNTHINVETDVLQFFRMKTVHWRSNKLYSSLSSQYQSLQCPANHYNQWYWWVGVFFLVDSG